MAMRRCILGGLLVLSLLAAAGCGQSATPRARATATTTATPQPTPTTAATPTAPATATPIANPTTVYLGLRETVWALDKRSGAVKWKYNSGANLSGDIGQLTVEGDKLLFLDTGTSSLTALSTTDGTVLWRASVMPAKQIVVAGNVALVVNLSQSSPNFTAAVSLTSGKVLWTQNTAASQFLAGNGIVYRQYSVGGSDTIPAEDGYIQALDPATGTVLWQDNGYNYALAGLIGNTLYTISAGGVIALNAQTGAQEWSQPVSGSLAGTLWTQLNGTTLLFASLKQYGSFDIAQRKVLWQTPLQMGLEQYQNGVICGNTSLGNVLYGLDASTGKLLWQLTRSAGYSNVFDDNGLCIAGSSVVQPNHQEPLVAIDAQTGAVRWTSTVAANPYARFAPEGTTVIAANGIFYTFDGAITAISEANGATLWSFDPNDVFQTDGSLAVGP